MRHLNQCASPSQPGSRSGETPKSASCLAVNPTKAKFRPSQPSAHIHSFFKLSVTRQMNPEPAPPRACHRRAPSSLPPRSIHSKLAAAPFYGSLVVAPPIDGCWHAQRLPLNCVIPSLPALLYPRRVRGPRQKLVGNQHQPTRHHRRAATRQRTTTQFRRSSERSAPRQHVPPAPYRASALRVFSECSHQG